MIQKENSLIREAKFLDLDRRIPRKKIKGNKENFEVPICPFSLIAEHFFKPKSQENQNAKETKRNSFEVEGNQQQAKLILFKENPAEKERKREIKANEQNKQSFFFKNERYPKSKEDLKSQISGSLQEPKKRTGRPRKTKDQIKSSSFSSQGHLDTQNEVSFIESSESFLDSFIETSSFSKKPQGDFSVNFMGDSHCDQISSFGGSQKTRNGLDEVFPKQKGRNREIETLAISDFPSFDSVGRFQPFDPIKSFPDMESFQPFEHIESFQPFEESCVPLSFPLKSQMVVEFPSFQSPDDDLASMSTHESKKWHKTQAKMTRFPPLRQISIKNDQIVVKWVYPGVLPEDILVHMLQFLSYYDIEVCRGVCMKWSQAIRKHQNAGVTIPFNSS